MKEFLALCGALCLTAFALTPTAAQAADASSARVIAWGDRNAQEAQRTPANPLEAQGTQVQQTQEQDTNVSTDSEQENNAEAAKQEEAQKEQPKSAAEKKGVQGQEIQKVRVTWPAMPGAVRYEFVLLRNMEDIAANELYREKYVFEAGCEVDLSGYGAEKSEFHWKVRPLNYDGKAIGAYSPLHAITEGESNPISPKPTTEFEQMSYAPLYPVYSWIPTLGAARYEVQVWQKDLAGESKLLETLYSDATDCYDLASYTIPGNYYWRVRALDATNQAIGTWSPQASFHVTSPVKVAALGDSITHGGGVISVPPGYQMYNWETYSDIPIKNLGYSGNTVEAMLERFENDVLPFSPRVLVIMGGVNNYRLGDGAWSIIHALAEIRDKCNSYGIIPVFATVTPLNPYYIGKCQFIEMPPEDWMAQQQVLNQWIMAQKYSVDVARALTDDRGWLGDGFTTDGLHPDYSGKKHIGQAIAKYLHENFSWLVG